MIIESATAATLLPISTYTHTRARYTSIREHPLHVLQTQTAGHLNESQRGMVAANIANLPNGGNRGEQTANLQCGTRAQAASKLNVSERTVNTAKKVQHSLLINDREVRNMTESFETHLRFLELETIALLEVGYFDEDGNPKQGPEGAELIELAHKKLKEQGVNIPAQ